MKKKRRSPIKRQPRGQSIPKFELPELPALPADVTAVPAPARSLADKPWLWYGITAVAIIFFIGFSIFILRLLGTIDDQNSQLIATQQFAHELRIRVGTLERELKSNEEFLGVLTSRHATIMHLAGTPRHPAGYGTFFRDRERKLALLHVASLPPCAAGTTYQLWLIGPVRPISAGLFTVSESGTGFIKVENVAESLAGAGSRLAVTLEHEGGATQPSTDIYLQGTGG